MPTPTPNRFTSYEFTEEERKSAEVLNPLQKMHLQTEVARIAMQMLNLDAGTKSDLPDFEIQRAFLKGQMTSLEYIIQLSESRELNIIEEDASKNYIVSRTPSGDQEQQTNLYNVFTNTPNSGE